MLIGYARVSTAEQNLTLQVDELQRAGCEKIFSDKASGAKFDRAGLAEALTYAREGDSLVVWKLDRLGRSMKGLIELAATLEARKIDLRSASATPHPGARSTNCARDNRLPAACLPHSAWRRASSIRRS